MSTYGELYKNQITAFCDFISEYVDAHALAEKPMEDALLVVYNAGLICQRAIEEEDIVELKRLGALHPEGAKVMEIVNQMPEETQRACAKFLKWVYHFAKEYIEGAKQ